MTTRPPKFEGTIAYTKTPVPGVLLYGRPLSEPSGESESLDDLVAKLDKEDINAAKREEVINKIKARVAEAAARAAEAERRRVNLERGAAGAEARRFNIENGKPIPDPDGEYTFNEALRICAVEAGNKAGIGVEKVSEIITAITPFMQRGAEQGAEVEQKKQETTILTAFLEHLKERGGGEGQYLTMNDFFTFLEKMDEVRKPPAGTLEGGARQTTFLDQMQQFVGTWQGMRDMFGGGQRGEGSPPVYITLKGPDGQEGALPFDIFEKWDDRRWKRRKEEEELDSKMTTAKEVRNFLSIFGRAAARRAGGKEE